MTREDAPFRRLVVLNGGRQHQPHPHWRFSVMSYNVLAQVHLDNNRMLYRDAAEEDLAEDVRMPRILEHIHALRPDILCMQEVQNYRYLSEKLESSGYLGMYKQRTSKSTPQHDGCAIMYNSQKFSIVEEEDVEFNCNSVLCKDNVAQIVTLKVRNARRPTYICVANTHILYGPKFGIIKAGQLHMLFVRLFNHVKRIQAHVGIQIPVILCGDYNLVPHSNLYTYLTKGTLDLTSRIAAHLSGQTDRRPPRIRAQEHREARCLGDAPAPPQTPEPSPDDVVEHPFRLTSLYSLTLPAPYMSRNGRTELVSTTHLGWRGTVDFIFFGALDLSLVDLMSRDWQALVGDRNKIRIDSDSDGDGEQVPSGSKSPPIVVLDSPPEPSPGLEDGEVPLDATCGASLLPLEQPVPPTHKRKRPAKVADEDLRPCTLVAEKLLELPSVRSVVPVPNAQEGSDHFSVYGQFRLEH
ncbi:Protein angel 2 [Sorochytrium milnesiophthora]